MNEVKKEVSPAVMGAIVVVVLVLIGAMGYKFLGPKSVAPPDDKMKAAMDNMHKMNDRKPGEMPAGMTPPASAMLYPTTR